MESRDISGTTSGKIGLGISRPLLDLVRRIQRNHALEHATINLLTQQYPGARIVGISGPLGFALYSSLTAEEIVPAARRALSALQSGQSDLAIHASCGTNLVVTAVLTTLASFLGLGCGRRSKQSLSDLAQRLPQVVLLNAAALIFAEPIARWVQGHLTTDTDLATTEIASVFTDIQSGLHRVRVHTRQRG